MLIVGLQHILRILVCSHIFVFVPLEEFVKLSLLGFDCKESSIVDILVCECLRLPVN